MKHWKLFLFSIISFLLLTTDCLASTNTYTRSEDNLLVPKDVVVNQNNIQDILKTPSVSSKEKIYDFADLYTDLEEEDLYQKLDSYTDSSDIDSVVVTTKDLGGFSISDYTYHFYDYNDFKNNGVIFVIYVSDEVQIFMGNSGDKEGEVFKTYTDRRINDTLKYVYQDIKVGNYYKATDNYIKILQAFYNLDREGNYRVDEEGNIVKEIPWVEIAILSFALTFITVILLFYRLNNHHPNISVDDLETKIDNSTLVVKLEHDLETDTTLSKEK